MEPNVYEFVDGVLMGLWPNLRGDAIYVMKILTEPGARNYGAASEALRAVRAEADVHRVQWARPSDRDAARRLRITRERLYK